MPADYRSAYGLGEYGEGLYGLDLGVDIGRTVPFVPSARTATRWAPFGDMDGNDGGRVVAYRRPAAEPPKVRVYKTPSRRAILVRLQH